MKIKLNDNSKAVIGWMGIILSFTLTFCLIKWFFITPPFIDEYGQRIHIRGTGKLGVSASVCKNSCYGTTFSWEELKQTCPDSIKEIQQLENEAKNKEK